MVTIFGMEINDLLGVFMTLVILFPLGLAGYLHFRYLSEKALRATDLGQLDQGEPLKTVIARGKAKAWGLSGPQVNKVLEILGSCSGLLGAALLARNDALSGYGFVAFLVSNACWMIFGLRTSIWGMVVMQIGFTATSVIGIVNWL